MKSLPLLLSLFLAPALAAQEDNSKTDAPKQIAFDIKIESHGEGIPKTVQKMIKLVAPEGAGKYHTLNLPGGKGTMVIKIETSGDLEDVKWALLQDSFNIEDALGCSLEDIPSGDCETDEGCCGKCDSTPKAFVRVNGEEVQFGMDKLPPEIRAHIKSALSEGIVQVGDFPLVIGGDNPHAPHAVFLADASFGRTQGSNFLWKVDRGSATCSNGRDLWNRSTANTSCSKADASCSKAAPTTCSKSSSCGTSRTLWASSPATGRNLWGGTAKASCGTQPSCQTDSSCSKKSSCGNTGSKSPWNRYL